MESIPREKSLALRAEASSTRADPPTIHLVIASRLVDWQRRHGRHDLPWQNTRDPYRIWLSEIMLQQTRVSSVVPYFLRFVDRFPTLAALAAADEDEVLALWSGLGYYSRARNLHRCARQLVAHRSGIFPSAPDELERLPGIGRSTAAAIAVFAFGRRAAILDGNVRRVFARWAGIDGRPAQPAVLAELWRVAERELPHEALEAYTQGLMDLGASLCSRSRPACGRCPLADDCVAHREGRVASIPAPRPRRALPLRERAWLILRCADRVLLEKRPSSGLWGGLWCVPEVPPDTIEEALRDTLRRFALHPRACEALAPVDHAFTHFRLRAQPLLLDCEPIPRVAEARSLPHADAEVDAQARTEAEAGAGTEAGADGRVRWLSLTRTREAPLPAPVKTLLGALADGQ